VGNNPVSFVDPDGSETIEAKLQRINDIATYGNSDNYLNILEANSFNLKRKYIERYYGKITTWKTKYGKTFFGKDCIFLNTATMQQFQKGNTEVIKCCLNILQIALPDAYDLWIRIFLL